MLLPLLLVTASPLAAQETDVVRIDKRVGKLESELRAVQRKVFPGGESRYFEPEITAPAAAPAPVVGTPATAPLTDLTDRLGELERQLRTLTGQVEANQFKLRQLDEAMTKQRADVEFRLGALETGGARPATAPGTAPGTPAAPAAELPAEAPPRAPAKPASSPKAATADAAWKQAYANVTSKDWPGTEAAMTAFIADWPKSTRQTQAQYWLGRSHAERDQHAQAARAFLKVYESAPRSAQAPDSLLGLADAMFGLKKPTDACRVLGELDSAYGEKLTPAQTAEATAARKRAKCPA
ncbi:tetratricopeptide repeat protein [Polymorphobacter fuscus]|uniref:tetratricopeptide repeat protein n=1 Tax=Sandarakinorhabdus fusca TaxID=1439888 RepID=UPI001A9CABCC|nr:tetratricopeptide repeat protein [Polymorphobacter fuscus]